MNVKRHLRLRLCLPASTWRWWSTKRGFVDKSLAISAPNARFRTTNALLLLIPFRHKQEVILQNFPNFTLKIPGFKKEVPLLVLWLGRDFPPDHSQIIATRLAMHCGEKKYFDWQEGR